MNEEKAQETIGWVENHSVSSSPPPVCSTPSIDCLPPPELLSYRRDDDLGVQPTVIVPINPHQHQNEKEDHSSSRGAGEAVLRTWNKDDENNDNGDDDDDNLTEIEYYSTEEEEEEEEEINEEQEEEEDSAFDPQDGVELVDYNDDSSSYHPFCGDSHNGNKTKHDRIEHEMRLQLFQDVTSRFSFRSMESDAFSLPVGLQDDVSTLDCDTLEQNPGIKGSMSSEEKDDEEISAVGIQSDSPMIIPSTPTRRAMLGPGLPEHREEDENEERNPELNLENKLGETMDKIEGVIGDDTDRNCFSERMHRSFFIPPPSAVLNERTQSVEQSTVRVMEDIALEEYAKNLPPELDFQQAKKYLIQLAGGVLEPLGSPKTPASRGLPRWHTGMAIPTSQSEYTEISVQDDFCDVALPRLERNTYRRGGIDKSPRESVLSSDYTEILIEESIREETIFEESIDEAEPC